MEVEPGEETVEAEVLDPSNAELEVYEHPAAGAALAVSPNVTAGDLVARLTVIREAMQQAMLEGVDYGVIPGTDKPALFKPGSEKLGALFQLDIQIDNEKIWGEAGHLTVISRATVFHQPTGTRLGSGEGMCSTREAKYAYRQASRICPACGAGAIIKGRAEYGGGWLCWKNHKTIPGCGAKFQDGDKAIEGQEAGRLANENLPDTYNTVVKMASKRARVDAVLAVTGASALFTQDVEDFQDGSEPSGGQPARQTQRAQAPAPSPEPQAGTAKPRMATDRQLKAMHTVKGKLIEAGHFSEEQWETQIYQDYGVYTTKDLTAAQASEVIERLKRAEGSQ